MFLFFWPFIVWLLPSGQSAGALGSMRLWLAPLLLSKGWNDPILELLLSGIYMKWLNVALKRTLKVEGLEGGEHHLPSKPVEGFLNETE